MTEPWQTTTNDHDNPNHYSPDDRLPGELLRRAAGSIGERDHRIAALQEEVRVLNEKLHERNSQYEQLKTMISRLKAAEAQLQIVVKDRTSELTALRSAQLVTQREQQALLEAQRLELEAARNLAHDKQTQLKLTEAQLHQLQDKLKEREQMVSEANLTLQAADTQIGILEQKIEMMEREFQSREESLHCKLAESEAGLLDAQQQYHAAITSKAVLESQIESLKISHDKLLAEFKTAASTMSDKWASAQVQFFKDADQAISRLHKRIETAIQCQTRLTYLLQKSVQKCSLFAERLDRRNQRVQSLKLILRRDLNEREKTQKAYETGLLQIDRLNQNLRAAERQTAHAESTRDELKRRLNQAVSERNQSDIENDKLRSALNVAQEKIDLITKHNDELKCEVSIQRSLVEHHLAEERARELALRGEAALHQSARRQAERQLKQEQNKSRTITNHKTDMKPVSSSVYNHPLLHIFHQTSNNNPNTDDTQSQSEWYQELLDKMNGLICKVDESIVHAAGKSSLNQPMSSSTLS